MLERLQKILSARGIASRRKAEEYIEKGLVKVNGKTAILGQKADPETDKIVVDGTVLQERAEMLYYLMHKPVGIVTENVDHSTPKPSSPDEKKKKTKSQQVRNVPNVRDLLPAALQGRIYPVGRLDKDSSGLLLLTNDGVLAYRLTHPKFDHEKEYEVTVEHPIKDGALQKLEKGMTLDGVKTKPATVKRLGPSKFRIALTEGKNRQIRRMCQKVGSPVVTLERVRIMTLGDRSMKPGDIRPLTANERDALLKSIQA